MVAGAASLLFGIACGLRLTLLPFICVMTGVLTGVVIHAFLADGDFIASLGRFALVASALQLGYVGGIWIRSRRS